MGNYRFCHHHKYRIALIENQKHKTGEEYLSKAVPVAGNFGKLLLCWFLVDFKCLAPYGT